MSCFAKAVLIIALLLAVVESAFSQNSLANVTLAWDPSPDPTVVGYRVYYGIASLLYTNFVEVDQGTSVTISNLTDGLVYYFAATTVDVSGLESDFSAELADPLGALPCTIIFTDVIQPYDGTPKSITTTTVPNGLPVIVTYTGLLGPPSAVGQYPFTALFVQGVCSGVATGTLTINPGVAAVGLDNLDQVYDGTPKPVQVNTTPQGLAVSITYNGQTNPPAQAGAYVVVATVVDENYTGSATATLIVEPASAQIQLDNLSQTYTGSPEGALASTIPPGLSVLVTYELANPGPNGFFNGTTDLPTEAGTYVVSASIQDPNYAGNASAFFVINPAVATVQLSGLTQVFDGTNVVVSAITDPPNVPVVISYQQQPAAPVNAGTYQVSAVVQSTDYTGSAVGTLTVLPASATVTVLNLSQTADGTPKPVETLTDPIGVSVIVTYNGVTQAPSAPGTYTVTATVTDSNYTGSATDVLNISNSSGSAAPSVPISLSTTPVTIPAANVPVLLLSWPTNTTGVTVWQSTDLSTWTPLTNMPASSGSLSIVPKQATAFFRATADAADGTSQIPLLMGHP